MNLDFSKCKNADDVNKVFARSSLGKVLNHFEKIRQAEVERSGKDSTEVKHG